MKLAWIILSLYIALMAVATATRAQPDPARGHKHVTCVNYRYTQHGVLWVNDIPSAVVRTVHVPCRQPRWYGPWRIR